MPQVIIQPDVENLARAAALLIEAIADEVLKDNQTFSVALSGGSTPRSLYELLASTEFRDRIDWSRTYFFFGDERCVPPDSPESNYRMAFESMLGPMSLPDEHIFRWRSELEPAETAEIYAQDIFEFFGGPPGFDLVLLGLGEDGHTASLFPHSPALAETKHFAVANWVEKLEQFRLTLTFPAINSASNVIFLAAGPAKSEAAAAILNEEGDVSSLPALGVNPRTGRVWWLLDAEAASGLDQTTFANTTIDNTMNQIWKPR
jgi:6-phosphogluconolactonase